MTIIQKQITLRNHSQSIAYISVNNSKRLNVLNQAATTTLIETMTELGRNGSLRAIVLSGAGTRAFIGGADIREMIALDAATAKQFITTLHQACASIRQAPVPVIARIQGYCLGAGLEIAASCDLRVATFDAVFGMPEVQVGLPSVIEAALLPRLIGWGKTSRLLLTGDTIDAEQALAWGLIEQLVSPADLDAAVDAIVDSIGRAGPRAIRTQKKLMRQWESMSLEQAIQQGIVAFRDTYHSDEPQRYMQRFIDRKR